MRPLILALPVLLTCGLALLAAGDAPAGGPPADRGDRGVRRDVGRDPVASAPRPAPTVLPPPPPPGDDAPPEVAPCATDARDTTAPVGPPALDGGAGPEDLLARQLGLDPEQTERVAEAIRAADAQLRGDMADLCERGYDDVAARHLGERFEEELLARVEGALPADRRAAFRDLMEAERRELDGR